ncbi:hypothetical protein AAMO2058_000564000 [Amorphochlora amoebiformis]
MLSVKKRSRTVNGATLPNSPTIAPRGREAPYSSFPFHHRACLSQTLAFNSKRKNLRMRINSIACRGVS